MNDEPCRFGYVEYDGDQYCFAHGGFRCHVVGGRCSKHPAPRRGAHHALSVLLPRLEES